ncbi:MAG: acyl-CoA dehydrogenase family protein [Actinomycetota bacterium]|nr:acyl-CoA dehydrogenase family protein [Actinomycetota bacterium]
MKGSFTSMDGEGLNEEDFENDLRTWVRSNWSPTADLTEWRTLLAKSGWGCPSWPSKWFGKESPPKMDAVAKRILLEEGAVGVAAGVSMYLVAPTLLEWADDKQLDRYLLPILTGEHKWCQLFSEPGAGSDLAGLSTRAELDGDEWIVNGQKVWNSGAQKADFGILLARTSSDVSKHQGISFFLIPMKQDGIEVRPLHQMNGHSSFNEVFFDNARVPVENMVANSGDGWRVALTTLAHERSAVATPRPRFPTLDSPLVQRAQAEADEYFSTYRWYPQRAGRPKLVSSEAQRSGLNSDPLIRQDVAEVEEIRRTALWTTQRSRDARLSGKPPGPEGSVAKLNMSVIARASHAAHTSIAGAYGMLSGPNAPLEGLIAEVLISTPAQSIAGGTDEIQRNILGERVLGLPKEPQVEP